MSSNGSPSRNTDLMELAHRQDMHNRGSLFAMLGAVVAALAVWIEFGATFGFITWGGLLFIFGISHLLVR